MDMRKVKKVSEKVINEMNKVHNDTSFESSLVVLNKSVIITENDCLLVTAYIINSVIKRFKDKGIYLKFSGVVSKINGMSTHYKVTRIKKEV